LTLAASDGQRQCKGRLLPGAPVRLSVNPSIDSGSEVQLHGLLQLTRRQQISSSAAGSVNVVIRGGSPQNCLTLMSGHFTVIILAVVGITYDTRAVGLYIARPTNAAIGRSPERRRAATSNKPTNSIKLPNDVINHDLQRRRRKHVLLLALVQSTGFKGCIIRWDVASQRSTPVSLTSGIRRRRRRRCTMQQFPQQRLSAN